MAPPYQPSLPPLATKVMPAAEHPGRADTLGDIPTHSTVTAAEGKRP